MSDDHKQMPWSLPFCLLPLGRAFFFWDRHRANREPLSRDSHPSCRYRPVIRVETHCPAVLKLCPQCTKCLGPCILRGLFISQFLLLQPFPAFLAPSWIWASCVWPLSKHQHFRLNLDSVAVLGMRYPDQTSVCPGKARLQQPQSVLGPSWIGPKIENTTEIRQGPEPGSQDLLGPRQTKTD